MSLSSNCIELESLSWVKELKTFQFTATGPSIHQIKWQTVLEKTESHVKVEMKSGDYNEYFTMLGHTYPDLRIVGQNFLLEKGLLYVYSHGNQYETMYKYCPDVPCELCKGEKETWQIHCNKCERVCRKHWERAMEDFDD